MVCCWCNSAAELKIGGVNPSCAKCGKSVYAEESMKSGAEDDAGRQVVFHNTCFKCETCNITLVSITLISSSLCWSCE
jgi:hypothetical protein